MENRLRHIVWLREMYIKYFDRFGIAEEYGIKFPELNLGTVPLWVDVIADRPSALKRFLEEKKNRLS